MIRTLLKSIAVTGFLLLLTATTASALVTEVGLNYSRKKNSLNSENYSDAESVTGSLSFYFWERLALELSYTDASGVRRERIASGANSIDLISTLSTKVYGMDLIWVLADRKALFQPYIKGGAARLERRSEVKDYNLNLTYALEPDVALVPSYGVGFKVALTQTFGLKFSYDAWKTPLGGGSYSNDDSLRAGITWML